MVFFASGSRTWRAPIIDEQYKVQGATSLNLNPERITAGNGTKFSGVTLRDNNLFNRS